MNKKFSHIIIPVLLFIISILVSCLSSDKIFHFQPTTTDENAYIFESRLFLKGRFFAVPHPSKDFFWTEQIVFSDKWFSRYSPGHSLVLAPGVLLKFNNLMPIIISSCTVIAMYFFLMNLTKNIIIPTIAGVVTISSPLFISMSGTCLSHTSSAFFIIMYIFILYKNIENNLGNTALSILSGFFWSFGFITRQYSSLLATAPFVLYHIFLCLRYRRYKNFIFFIIGSIPLIILFLLYNFKCTGNALCQTYLYYDPTQKLGFGMRFHDRVNLTPQAAFNQMKGNIIFLNEWMLGVPGFLFLLLVSIFFSKKNIPSPCVKGLGIWKMLFIASIVLIIGGYLFFFSQGLFWLGPNYYYDMFPILIILLFFNINYLSGRLARKISILALISAILIPLYFFYYINFMKTVVRDIQERTNELVSFKDIIKENNIYNAVIFVKSGRSLLSPPSILINNSPFLDDDVLIVNDKGAINDSLMLFYPERRFYKLYFTGKKDSSEISEIKHKNSSIYTLKFDNSFYSNTGKKIYVENSDRYIVYGRRGIDKPDYLLYGPYVCLPEGRYECIFYLKADKIKDDSPIAKIDICSDSGTKIYAEKILKGYDFLNKGISCKFHLEFSIDKPTEFETRVYFYANSDLMAKKIELIKK